MEKHLPGAKGAPEQRSDVSPLLTRIIRREQELEAAVAACRARGEEKIAAAREEAARILESGRVEDGEERRLLLAGAEEDARSEGDDIRRHALSRAEAILASGSSITAPVLEALLEIILPDGEGSPR